MVAASAAEVRYILQGIADDLREDGRRRLDFRYYSLEVGLLPQASGSSRLVSQRMDILVGVVAVLSEPDAAAPHMGRITVAVSMGPGESAASRVPVYTAGAFAVDDKRKWIEAALARLYSPQSAAKPLQELCIVPGAHCWDLRVHVQLLQTDGCPLDAVALAVRSALHDTCIPSVRVVDAGSDSLASNAKDKRSNAVDIEVNESMEDARHFSCGGLPLYVTLATAGGRLVADCTAKESHAVVRERVSNTHRARC